MLHHVDHIWVFAHTFFLAYRDLEVTTGLELSPLTLRVDETVLIRIVARDMQIKKMANVVDRMSADYVPEDLDVLRA
jgi:hypothetical protein